MNLRLQHELIWMNLVGKWCRFRRRDSILDGLWGGWFMTFGRVVVCDLFLANQPFN